MPCPPASLSTYPLSTDAPLPLPEGAQQRYQEAVASQPNGQQHVHEPCNRAAVRIVSELLGGAAAVAAHSDVEVSSQDQQRKRPPLPTTPGCTPGASPDKPPTAEQGG